MSWTPVPQGCFPTRRLRDRTTRARRQAPMSCAAAPPSIRFGDHGTPRCRRRLLCPAVGIGRARPSSRSIAPGDLREVRCLPIIRPWSPPGHRAAGGTPTGVYRRMTGDRPYAARGCHAAASGGHTGQGAHLGNHRPAVAGMTARTSLEPPVKGTTIPLQVLWRVGRGARMCRLQREVPHLDHGELSFPRQGFEGPIDTVFVVKSLW
jgi:hypothetical protein